MNLQSKHPRAAPPFSWNCGDPDEPACWTCWATSEATRARVPRCRWCEGDATRLGITTGQVATYRRKESGGEAPGTKRRRRDKARMGRARDGTISLGVEERNAQRRQDCRPKAAAL